MRGIVAGLAVLLLSSPLTAESVLFSGSDAAGRAAEALFETDPTGTLLTVTLTNTSAADPRVPSEILTALFFDTSTPWTLMTGDALLNAGSVIKPAEGTTPPATNDVGGEWAYKSNLSTAPGAYGISSTGADNIFGPPDRFDTSPSADLEPPESPDGVQYGITSLFDDPGNDNGGLSKNSLIANSVVFTFQSLTPLSLADIAGVTFLYGTSLSEPQIPGTPTTLPPPVSTVPEPASAALFGLGAFVMLTVVRRRRIAVSSATMPVSGTGERVDT